MSCTPDVATPRPIAPEELDLLRALVHSRCPAIMPFEDRDEVAGEILLSATRASATTEIPLIILALTEAKRSRYYERPAARLARFEPLDGRRFSDESRPPREVELGLVIWHEAEIELRDLIDRLPSQEKKVFVLCGKWGYTLGEAAAALGIPVSTAHRHLARAKQTVQGGWLVAQTA